MELQPPLLPPLFPPHRLTLRKHVPLQPPRQERPQTLASLRESVTECPPSPATWWISSPATERSHSSRTSTRQAAQSLPLYILRVFAQFLPALLMPCSRRGGKPRHVSLNARRFQKGESESLWNQTLKHNVHTQQPRAGAMGRLVHIGLGS